MQFRRNFIVAKADLSVKKYNFFVFTQSVSVYRFIPDPRVDSERAARRLLKHPLDDQKR